MVLSQGEHSPLIGKVGLCFQTQGVQKNPGIQDVQVSQPSPLHQSFIFPSQHSDVAWPTWLGCVVVNLLWSSAILSIK